MTARSRIGPTAKVALVTAVVLAVCWGSAEALMRSSWPLRIMRERIVGQLGRALGAAVSIERLERGPGRLSFELVGLDVGSVDGSTGVLEVSRATGQLSWRTFLGGGPVIESLVIDSPVLALQEGVLSMQAVAGLDGLESISDIEIREFELRDGRLVWNGRDYPLAVRGSGLSLRAEFDPTARNHRVEASFEELEFTAHGTVALPSTSASMTAIVGADGISITSASLEGPGIDASLRGSLLGEQLGTMSVAYRIRSAISLLAGVVGAGQIGLSGQAEIVGEVNWDRASGQPRYAGTFRTTGVRLPAVEAGLRLAGIYSGTGDQVEISDMAGSLLGAEVSATLSARGPPADWTLAMSGEARSVSLAAVAEAAGVTNLPWDGLFNVTWESSGSAVDGLCTRVGAEIVPVSSPAKIPLSGAVHLVHSTDSGQVEVEGLTVRTPNLDLSGSGFRTGDGSGQISVDLTLASREAVERVLAVAQPGTGLPMQTPAGAYAYRGTLRWVGPALANAMLDGEFRITDLVAAGQAWGSLAVDGTLGPGGLAVRNGRLLDGTGRMDIVGRFPLGRDGEVSLEVTAVALDAAKLARTIGFDLPVSGSVGMTASVFGTAAAPRARASVEVDSPACFGERFDRLEAQVEYGPAGLRIRDAVLWRDTSTLRADASFEGEPREVTIDAESSDWPLEGFTWARVLAPHLAGSARFDISASGQASSRTRLSDLAIRGDWSVSGLRASDLDLGDWRGSVRSARDAPELALAWDAELFDGQLRGSASIGTAGSSRYEGTLEYVGLSPLAFIPLGARLGAGARGAVTGSAAFSGSTDRAGSFDLSGLIDQSELLLPAAGRDPISITNVFPLRWAIRDGSVRLDSMSLTGADTSFQVDGTIGLLEPRGLDVSILGDISLATLHGFLGSFRPVGTASIRVRIGGTLEEPLPEGRLSVRDASLDLPGSPLRVGNVNGVVAFEGGQARIERLDGQSGGGHVRMSGVAELTGAQAQYRLRADVEGVRVNYPATIHSVVDGQLTLAGAGLRSLLDGNIAIARLSTADGLSIGELFAGMQQTSLVAASEPVLDGMQINVHIGSVPQLPVETQLVRDAEVGIDLSVVGTVADLALVGQVQILEGELRMLGTHYRINRGQVRFLGPAQRQPVLDVDLETRIRDVDLELVLSGPADSLNLSYRSDPPLPFHSLVDLVAVGKEPTIDPSISSRRRIEQQSVVQTGADNLLSQAISRPVSKRLQRFFGVSRLKVDPQVGGLESNPSARLSTEQQIADDITLIYSYDLSSAQQQAIRIEWNPDRKWSFIVTRDQNGLIGSDILFKLRRR